jgi:hypothetical protein
MIIQLKKIINCFLLTCFTFKLPSLILIVFYNAISFLMLNNIYFNQTIFNASISIISSIFFLISEEYFHKFSFKILESILTSDSLLWETETTLFNFILRNERKTSLLKFAKFEAVEFSILKYFIKEVKLDETNLYLFD